MDRLPKLISDLLSGDDALAEAAVPAIAQLGRSALHALIRIARAPDPDHRWWAMRCLAELDMPAARQALRAGLNDLDPSVQECAALALRQHPSSGAIPDLVLALEAGKPLLKRLAADALAACGPLAVPSLAEAAVSSKPAVRIEAVRALASLNDPRAIPALYRALEDSSTLVGHWAEQGLDRLGMGMEYFLP